MAILGLRGSGDFTTDERPKNFRETILWRYPNGQTPLTALMAKMASESTDDAEYSWWEEELSALRLTLAAQVGNTTTANTLSLSATGSDAYSFVAGDILMVESSTTDPNSVEYLIVNADSTSTSIVNVTRAALGTTVSTIVTSTTLVKIGNAFREGTTSPSASGRQPTKLYNYTQIFKTAYDLTRTSKQTGTRTGDPLKNEKKRKMHDHAVAMELAFLFGKRLETTTGASTGRPIRYTGGVRSFLSSNVTTFAATATEANLMSFLEGVFSYNSGAGNERLLLCGGAFARAFNLLMKEELSMQSAEVAKVYGLDLQKYVMPLGTIYLKIHPLMNVISGVSKAAFVLDPSGIKYRYLQDTVAQDNIQANDADEQKGQWLTEAGIEVQHEKTMGFIQNFYYP